MMKMVCDKCGKEVCLNEGIYLGNKSYFIKIESEYIFERPFNEEFPDRHLCYDCHRSFTDWLKSSDV